MDPDRPMLFAEKLGSYVGKYLRITLAGNDRRSKPLVKLLATGDDYVEVEVTFKHPTKDRPKGIVFLRLSAIEEFYEPSTETFDPKEEY